jgi:hypothetical protein
LFAILILAFGLVLSSGPAEAVHVLTQHYDNARTGANTSETVLTPSNVNVNQFGKLWNYPVDGSIYAQPLYVQGLTIGGVMRNVVFVATMNNTVYAFNADGSGSPLWSRNLGPAVALPHPGLGTGNYCSTYRDISTQIGIVGSPAIDIATSTLYVVAKTNEGGTLFDRIHALDLATGAEKMGGPVAVAGSVNGKVWTSLRHNQRSSLAVANGRVYVTYAAYCDANPYWGWVFGYSASNLAAAPVIYNDAADGSQAGIWMSGNGPNIDAAGNLYVISGNGTVNAHNGGQSLGNAVIKLSPTLQLLDWFVPYNFAALNSADQDLGACGGLLIPGTSLYLASGKEGKVYVLATNNLGRWQSGSDSQIVQTFKPFLAATYGSPVTWASPSGRLIYYWAQQDYLKALRVSGSLLETTPYTQSTFTGPPRPGGMLTVSANGSSNGILWANIAISQNANQAVVPGVLRAFNAANLTQQLWTSQDNAARDSFGNFAKNVSPLVVNGRVYMATFSNQLAVYGLLSATPTPTATPPPTATPTVTPTTPPSATATSTSTATATSTATSTPTGATPTPPRPTATATRPTAAPTAGTPTPTPGGAAAWQPSTFYSVGTLVTYGGATYRCQQSHTSQVGWEPPNVPALWVRQ